ncbi:MAG TPA: 4Fe-4S cluster-binding domain-containing protein [Candidatus Deferrimicrobium sp.]|nr:4Fe-4S cluster-binding domain-containing protein [Candidatus Deferrimicrobium sp.]
MDHTGNKSLDSDLVAAPTQDVATSPEVVAEGDGSYLQLSDAEFRARIRSAYGRMAACDLCPRRCGAHRLAGDTGYCGAALKPNVFVWNLHRGEEPPVSGARGSGTVFLSGCNLNCCYCQNYPLSQLHHGTQMPVGQLAGALVELQTKGAHNINFVTPSHQVPQLLAAVFAARQQGLHIPIVYNTSSYDEPSTLALLDGIVDIYLGDLRYTDEAVAMQLSGVADYVQVAERALIEMHRQVGDISVDEQGRYVPRGLIVRYLILPHHTGMAREVFGFVSRRLSLQTYVSVMTQYFPAYKAFDRALGIWRKLTDAECDRVMGTWSRSGLVHGWVQDMGDNGGA